jgi:hypothetical protein
MITVGYRHFTIGAGSIDFETQEQFDKWYTTDEFEFKITSIIRT